MKRFDILPRIGIGPIKFGAPRAAVREALAAEGVALEVARGSQDYFFEASIEVDYEDDDTVSFIGINSHKDVLLCFHHVDLFDTEARVVFDLFAQVDRSGAHLYSQSEYVFPSQILTLYEADSQYDRRGGESRSVWGQIGAGDPRYLETILKIANGQLNRPPTKKK